MREVGVLEAKTRLSELLDDVEGGGADVLITRRGKPVARLASVASADRPRRLHGADLVEKARLLRERIALEDPALTRMTWDDLKAAARE